MAGVIINKKGVSNDGRSGGVFVGDRHSANSGGIPVVVDGGGSALVESDEPIIIPEAVNNPKLHSFNGKKKTAKEILSEINTKYKGVPIKKKGGMLEKGGAIPVKAGSVIITRNAYLDSITKNIFDGKKMTNREVLSKINAEGGGVEFGEGGITKKEKDYHKIYEKYSYGKGGKLYESETTLSEKKVKLDELESDYEKICAGIADKEIELKSEIDRLKYEWDEVKYSGISDDKLKNIGSSIISMSDELVHDINNLFPIVNKSPYSSSIYSGKKDWGFTEIDSYTVADHFNFYSSGTYHKLTTTPVIEEIKKSYPNYDFENSIRFENSFWVLAKFIKGARCYDENKWDLASEKEGAYEIIKVYKGDSEKMSKFDKLENAFDEKRRELMNLTPSYLAYSISKLKEEINSYQWLVDNDYKSYEDFEKKTKKALKERYTVILNSLLKKINDKLVLATVTKKEWGGRVDYFKLLSEDTYKGFITGKTPSTITIFVNPEKGNGFLVTGKDYTIDTSMLTESERNVFYGYSLISTKALGVPSFIKSISIPTKFKL
jgi:hypothetical protein